MSAPNDWPEGVPFPVHFDEDGVMKALTAYVATNGGVLPGHRQMLDDGLLKLYQAMGHTGGVRYWRAKFPAPATTGPAPSGWPASIPWPNTWNADAVRTVLAVYVGNDGEGYVPPLAQMRADGLELLYRKMAQYGSVRYWKGQFPASEARRRERREADADLAARRRHAEVEQMASSCSQPFAQAAPARYPIALLGKYSVEPTVVYYTVLGFLQRFGTGEEWGCGVAALQELRGRGASAVLVGGDGRYDETDDVIIVDESEYDTQVLDMRLATGEFLDIDMR